MSKKLPCLDILTTVSENRLIINLSGCLTKATANTFWEKVQNDLNTNDKVNVSFDLAGIDRSDSIGLTTLKELIKECEANNKTAQCINIPEDVESLWHVLVKDSDEIPIVPLEMRLNKMQKFGKTLCDQVVMLKQNITYLGETIYFLYLLLRNPQTLNFKKLCYYLEDMGPNTIPLVALIGTLFGVILTFQSAVQLKQFGAEVYTASLVSISLIRELGPLLVAIIMTCRTASAYAAEISSMKVNQEIDALQTMALDPIPFLVIPRIVAAAIIAPVLTLFMDFFGLLGCGIIMRAEGFTSDVIIQQMFSMLSVSDLIGGLVKPIVFGIVVVGLGCIHGLNCQRNSIAVGKTTTTTVVRCIVLITILDGIFTTVFYYLGL